MSPLGVVGGSDHAACPGLMAECCSPPVWVARRTQEGLTFFPPRRPTYSVTTLPSRIDFSHASIIFWAVTASAMVDSGCSPRRTQVSTKYRTSLTIDPAYAVYVCEWTSPGLIST